MNSETSSDKVASEIARTNEEIEAKIDELHAFSDYGTGPRADGMRYKHQGWMDALRWVLGSDLGEQP